MLSGLLVGDEILAIDGQLVSGSRPTRRLLCQVIGGTGRSPQDQSSVAPHRCMTDFAGDMYTNLT
jgi:hypothetical protein